MDAWAQDTSKLLTTLEGSDTDNDAKGREREDLRL
jgi:hypothetical protein